MRVLLVVAVLVAHCLLLSESALLEGSVEDELLIYRERVRYISKLLVNECSSYIREHRQLSNNNEHLLQIEKGVFEGLMKDLIECRNQKRLKSTVKTRFTKTIQTTPTTTKQTTPTTTKQTTPTTTKQTTTTTTKQTILTTTKQTTPTTTKQTTPTTTKQTTPTTTKLTTPTTRPPTQPFDCQQAVSYTQSWRRDHKGSNIKPGGLYSSGGYACDLNINSPQWFRFSGAAGTHMLDSCPKRKSCGAYYPLWTDERMPTQIGVEAIVKVYGVDVGCKTLTRSIKVMRCSWNSPHDLIYKQTNDYTHNCIEAFCGMM